MTIKLTLCMLKYFCGGGGGEGGGEKGCSIEMHGY